MHNYCYLHQIITTIFRTLNFSTGDWNVFLRDIFILVRSNPRLCHASFRCNLYISRVFSTLFTLLSPPSSRPVRADTHGTLEITGLSPLSWKLLRPSVFRVHQPSFPFTQSLSRSSAIRNLYVKLGYHHAVQGSTPL